MRQGLCWDMPDTPTLSPPPPCPILADLAVREGPGKDTALASSQLKLPRAPEGGVLQCFGGVPGAVSVGAGYVSL